MGCERANFGNLTAHALGIVGAQAVVDPHVLADSPAQCLQPLQESRETSLPFRVVRRQGAEHPDPPHPLRLLRSCRERPRRSRATEQRDEVATLHSITSSAATSSLSGTARPSILAVGWFMTSSNLLDCTTGRSAGFAPLRRRPQ